MPGAGARCGLPELRSKPLLGRLNGTREFFDVDGPNLDPVAAKVDTVMVIEYGLVRPIGARFGGR